MLATAKVLGRQPGMAIDNRVGAKFLVMGVDVR
jgi:hypothetical protein